MTRFVPMIFSIGTLKGREKGNGYFLFTDLKQSCKQLVILVFRGLICFSSPGFHPQTSKGLSKHLTSSRSLLLK